MSCDIGGHPRRGLLRAWQAEDGLDLLSSRKTLSTGPLDSSWSSRASRYGKRLKFSCISIKIKADQGKAAGRVKGPGERCPEWRMHPSFLSKMGMQGGRGRVKA